MITFVDALLLAMKTPALNKLSLELNKRIQVEGVQNKVVKFTSIEIPKNDISKFYLVLEIAESKGHTIFPLLNFRSSRHQSNKSIFEIPSVTTSYELNPIFIPYSLFIMLKSDEVDTIKSCTLTYSVSSHMP